MLDTLERGIQMEGSKMVITAIYTSQPPSPATLLAEFNGTHPISMWSSVPQNLPLLRKSLNEFIEKPTTLHIFNTRDELVEFTLYIYKSTIDGEEEHVATYTAKIDTTTTPNFIAASTVTLE